LDRSRYDNVQGICVRSAHFGQNGGCDESRGNFAITDFHQIWSRNVLRCLFTESRKTFSNIFTSGVICPQNLKLKVNHTGTSLRGDRLHCNEILFTSRCSSRAREYPRSGKLFSTTYDCGATGHQSCPIFGFWLVFPIQNP